MPTLYAEIDINAPQSLVWEALMRKDRWRYWNTFLYDCEPGIQIARGNELFLAMQRLEGDEETEIQPLITMLRPPSLMKWTASIPGLKTEHTFELQERMPGRTRYLHRETFSGILSKVFLPFIRQDERQGLRRMAHQLKMHVENDVLGKGGDRGYPQQRYNRPDYNRPDYSRPDYDRPDYNRPDYNRPDYDRGYEQPRRPPENYPPNYPPRPPSGDRRYGGSDAYRPGGNRPYEDRERDSRGDSRGDYGPRQ